MKRKSPSSSELNSLLKTIAQRIVKLLEKRGLIVRDEGTGDKFLDLSPDEPMDQIHGSSITYRIALGKYKGQKALTLGSLPNSQNSKSQKDKDKPFLSKYSGFSLHGEFPVSPMKEKSWNISVVIFQDPA